MATYAEQATVINNRLGIDDEGEFYWLGDEQVNLCRVQYLIHCILAAHPRHKTKKLRV